jgi:hypothetical protein
MWSNCRNSKCAVPGVSTAVLRTFRTSGPRKTGLVTTRRFLQIPHHRPRIVRKMQTGPRDALNSSPLGSRQADLHLQIYAYYSMIIDFFRDICLDNLAQ